MNGAPAPFPIPYQGSKRRLARTIVACFPPGRVRLFEPFCGSAAVSLAAAAGDRATALHLNDANEPLMALWDAIVRRPAEVAAAYQEMWEAQRGRERAFYERARADFNRTHRPELLLFLLSRCVKGAVRYNRMGAFNQSADLRRLGARPERVARNVARASALLAGRVTLTACDYRDALGGVGTGDLVYLDPPYQGVVSGPDRRYREGVSPDDLVEALRELERRDVSYLLSYDGRTGSKTHGRPLPDDLRLLRLELPAGRSSQATLLGRTSGTFESLYVSRALVARWPAARAVS